MKQSSQTGIVTCCYARDEHLAKATCASVRYFCPDVPLCITVDGDLDIDRWASVYNATVLYVRNLQCKELRRVMMNSFFAKHAALFEGPFEKFIYLDSDAIVWGNPFKAVVLDSHDFTIFGGSGKVDPRMIEKWMFSMQEMQQFDPEFQLLDHPYFCAGVYGARKNCIPKDRFLELAPMALKDKALFTADDQSVINYLVFSEAERGKLTHQCVDVFCHPSHFPKQDMDARFMRSWLHASPPVPSESLILHFSGRKPVPLFGGSNHKATFTFFRLQHCLLSGRSKLQAFAILIGEDLLSLGQRAWRKLKRLVRPRAS